MLPESSAYLENTLQFHSSFKEAAVGLRTVKCVLLLKKHDMFDVATVAEGVVRVRVQVACSNSKAADYRLYAYAYAYACDD